MGNPTVSVPPYVWAQAQEITGQSRPSSFIQHLITEGMQRYLLAQAATPEEPPAEEFDEPTLFDKPDDVDSAADHGTIIRITRETLCNECGWRVNIGSQAVIRTNRVNGYKEIIHLDHLERP